ncbi:MAG: ribbon-helix-helix domain-containing protein [Candidatus Bathyarchaeota archaeon]|nr:ribbon-helix-helix domain-containing protein [Candidatus Bathyarchaeota archaeon]
MGRISAELPDELEKKLRFKTIERFGGKKGDLSKAVEEAVKTWVAKE